MKLFAIILVTLAISLLTGCRATPEQYPSTTDAPVVRSHEPNKPALLELVAAQVEQAVAQAPVKSAFEDAAVKIERSIPLPVDYQTARELTRLALEYDQNWETVWRLYRLFLNVATERRVGDEQATAEMLASAREGMRQGLEILQDEFLNGVITSTDWDPRRSAGQVIYLKYRYRLLTCRS